MTIKNKTVQWAVAGYFLVTVAILSILWAPIAVAGTLTNVSDVVTDPTPSAVTSHQFAFQPPSTTTVKYITFTFPSGFSVSSGATTVGLRSGIGAGTLSFSSSLIACYRLTTAANLSGSIREIELRGVTNTSLTGTATIAIQTWNGGTTCLNGTAVDSANVQITIDNPASIPTTQLVFAFSISSGVLNFTLDPVNNPSTTTILTLTVATNASSGSGGYNVTARITGSLAGRAYSSASIPAWTGTAASPTTWNTASNPNFWGLTRDAFPGTDAGKYFGLTTTAQTVMSGTGPTNADVQQETYQVAIDYRTPGDTYVTSIIFVGTPSF